MWIAIVIVGLVVLGLAAYAALGRLGEMRPDAITDSPKGRVPDGQVDAEFMQGLVIPLRTNGYSPKQVDAFLDEVIAGTAGPAVDARFDVVRRGYDMTVVDDILDRVSAQEPGVAQTPGPLFVDAAPSAASDSDALFRPVPETAVDDAEDVATPQRGLPEGTDRHA